MAGHFDCIGFRFEDREQYANDIVDLVRRSSQPTSARRAWIDPSGAVVVAFLEDSGSIRCAKPSFRATRASTVTATGLRADDAGCPYCSVATVEVLDETGAMAYPLAIELDDVDSSGPLFEDGHRLSVGITAFAESYRRWADVREYDEDPARPAPNFASRSLIPSGLFSPGGPDRPVRSEAIITGVIGAAEVRTNSLTGHAFQWAAIETFGGTYDMVAPGDDPPLATGNVMQGTFWLVGHLMST